MTNSISKYLFILGAFTLLTSQAYGNGCGGKADIGPAYIHIDVLESGRTVHRMDLAAVKADATIVLWKGLCLKPTLLYGSGHGYILTTGMGLGFIFPIQKNFCITPSAGYNYTYLRTHITVHTPFFVLHNLKEKFRSNSPYIACDVSYTFCPGWRICGNVQYAWSSTHTTIRPLVSQSSHSNGASYSALLEYDLNCEWSVNVGGAYNSSLSKEKHGIRGAGVKLGLARWF